MGKQNELTAQTVELDAKDGVAFIEQASPLTRLHYFDGKFLRADAFALEQDYHRQRSRLGNLAGGWGAVQGFGIALSGDALDVGAGLAITAAGNFVLATGDMQAKLADLLKLAAAPPPTGSASFADCLEASKPGVKETAGLAVYEITVGPIEGLCGNEPVYGKLCDSACASDSQHPFWREGVVLRLRPVSLQLPVSAAVPAAVSHLRNRVASAYFRAEPWLTSSALSASGLASGVWCEPAQLYGRDEVVIGLLAREGGVNRLIDAWSGRRERMDTQARGYWQGRMAMRPWNVFIAQILQFQCQLSGLFEAGNPVIQPAEDCDKLRSLLAKTRKELEGLVHRYGQSTKKILLRTEGRRTAKEIDSVASDVASSFADLDGLSAQLAEAETGQGALPKQRMLLNAGFFELPPAGYLPIDPQQSVEAQTARMFGEGVRLHYHAVRSDEIGHLVEQAQHLDRISLTRGLDKAQDIEQVEIFVPDGQVRGVAALATGTWWRLEMLLTAVEALFSVGRVKSKKASETVPPGTPAQPAQPAPAAVAEAPAADAVRIVQVAKPVFDGLVRTESREDGSQGVTLVAATDAVQARQVLESGTRQFKAQAVTPTPRSTQISLYLSADIAADPFDLAVGADAAITAEVQTMARGAGNSITINGRLSVLSRRSLADGREERLVQLAIQISEASADDDDDGKASALATRMRLLLQRDGNGATGLFVIDDEGRDPTSPPIQFEWDDAPRRALMFVEAKDAKAATALRKRMSLLRAATGEEDATAVAAEAFDAGSVRQRLMSMSGLPAMPAADSTVAVAAMNTLVALADVADDPALLLRARRRLFPTLDAPKTQTVRALHDWLMFRRARTPLCGPACDTAPAALALEAFQVWHLRLDSDKQLALLTAALDKGDEKTLASFAFRRVGILRYRDESAFSEESADRVLAMWADAEPAAQAVLGRVWESAPTTGQGWQNHFRLRNMLQQIASLTTPPTRGDGALAAIPQPSSRLADGALDGGMLVVTMGKTETQLRPHRMVMMTMDIYRKLAVTLKASPADGWKLLTDLLSQPRDGLIDIDMHFNAATQLDAADVSLLVTSDAKMRTPQHIEYLLHTQRLDASAIDAGQDIAAQHTDLSARLANTSSPPREVREEGVVALPVVDLGRDAQVMTIVGYEGVDLN